MEDYKFDWRKEVADFCDRIKDCQLPEEYIKQLKEEGMDIITINGKQYIDIYTHVKFVYATLVLSKEYEHLENSFDKLFFHNNWNGKYSNEGVCYIGVDSNWKGFYKIGKTDDITCKSRIHKTINPNYTIKYITPITENYSKLEREIHKYLSKKRVAVKGYKEWFELSKNEFNDLLKKFNFSEVKEN